MNTQRKGGNSTGALVSTREKTHILLKSAM